MGKGRMTLEEIRAKLEECELKLHNGGRSFAERLNPKKWANKYSRLVGYWKWRERIYFLF